MTTRRTTLVALLAGTAACASPTEQARAPSATRWVCDSPGREELLAFQTGGGVIVAKSIATGETWEVARPHGRARSVTVAGRSIYWSDDLGVHSQEPGAPRSRLVMMSPDIEKIATDGVHLVYTALDQLWVRNLSGGDSRRFATVVSRYQDYQHIVLTPRAIYWGNVHVRGNGKLPQDSLWTLALETGAQPVRIATLDLLQGYCIGPGGRVVWLDGGEGPLYKLPGEGQVTTVMQASGPIAAVRARSNGDLVATDTGFAFTTVVMGSIELSLWHVTLEGELTKIPTSLTVASQLLRVEQDSVVVQHDGRIWRVPIVR